MWPGEPSDVKVDDEDILRLALKEEEEGTGRGAKESKSNISKSYKCSE